MRHTPNSPRRDGAQPRTSRVRRLLAGALLGVLLAACSGDDDTAGPTSPADGGTSETTASGAEPVRGGVLVIGQDQGPLTLDTLDAFSFHNQLLLDGPYEALLELDEQLKPVPHLAEEFVQEDDTTYVFTLREGVQFHDGTPMTADDVVFTFERLLDPDAVTTQRSKLAAIESVTAVDDLKVRIELSAPSAPLLSYLASPDVTGIMGREFAEANDMKVNENGTGPFKITRFAPTDEIVLERFDGYWQDGIPYLDGVQIRMIPDNAARAAALRTGEIQMGLFLPDQMPLLETLDGMALSPVTYGGVQPLRFNCNNEHLAKLEVRQAIAWAIDEGALMQTIMPRLSAPTLVSPPAAPSFGYTGDGTDLPYWGADTDKAKALLADAGYPNGLQLRIMYSNTAAFAQNARIAEVLKEQLEPAGIDLQLNGLDYATATANSRSGDFDLYAAGYTMQADPDASLAPQLRSTGSTFCPDPALDTMIDAQARELDHETRVSLVEEAERYVAEQVYMAFLYSYPIRTEVWAEDTVHGYQPVSRVRRTSLRTTWLGDE